MIWSDILQMLADEWGHRLELTDCEVIPSRLWLDQCTFVFILYLCEQVQIIADARDGIQTAYYFTLDEPDSIHAIFRIIQHLHATNCCFTFPCQPTTK